MATLVLIKGAGDIASGIGHRLFRSGYDVIMTELERPTVIRRTVAFATAVFEEHHEIEQVRAECVSVGGARECLARRVIPVVVDPEGETVSRLRPAAVVDSILAKINTGTGIADADTVIGIGPGFTAGVDVHAVIETARGHDLGRVIVNGAASPNTGVPGEIGGYTLERLLRAPCDGTFRAVSDIGDIAATGDIVAEVSGEPVFAEISGVIRGLLHDGLKVHCGMKIGDIDPRCRREHCFTISDKARAIGGGVLEALLTCGIRP